LIQFGSDSINDLDQSLRLEWLETNGLGGFASSTITGANTRRYHGLLVAATHPPAGRRVLLSRVDEQLGSDGRHFDLATSVYAGNVIYPRGYLKLMEFKLDPWPVMTYQLGDITLVKSVMMRHGYNQTIISWHLARADAPCSLSVRPLVAGRDYHHLQSASGALNSQLQTDSGSFAIQPYDAESTLMLTYPRGQFWSDGLWYYDYLYYRERDRGLDCTEDLYSPGIIEWTLRPGETVYLCASTGPLDGWQPQQWFEAERQRRAQLVAHLPPEDRFGQALTRAADQFVVSRPQADEKRRTIIAGYPWFGDWGRDTMIALPGLLLATGRFDEAKSVLHAFAEATEDGLLPNTFDESGSGASYNTVDAALWMFIAAHRYMEATADRQFLADLLYPTLAEIIESYFQRTRFDIYVDDDGLLSAGNEQTQLTWMDADPGDGPVTPRHGKAVEINALWYNTLRIAAEFAEHLGQAEAAADFAERVDQIRTSFLDSFWDEQLGYLYDCITGSQPDSSLRPNQVIALALPYDLASDEQAAQILWHVAEKLLTPYGLHTLSPDDPDYLGRYFGDQHARDSTYHQGTVWPWLLGPYMTAYVKLHGLSEQTRNYLRELTGPLHEHLRQAGLGTISEIFDGDAPHYSRGCIAQAWSVAELLRCWIEYELFET